MYLHTDDMEHKEEAREKRKKHIIDDYHFRNQACRGIA